MTYYNDNTTTCFTTQLAREMRLTGDWSVGLVEIHIPCTIMHLRREDAYVVFKYDDSVVEEDEEQGTSPIADGIYETLEDLAKTIRSHPDLQDHLLFEETPNSKGFYSVEQKCTCSVVHSFAFSEKLRQIFGFESKEKEKMKFETKTFAPSMISRTSPVIADRPASLCRAIPDQLYVYTDVVIPYTVGDTQASLLRIISLDTKKYKFGANVVKNFAPVHYIPLLHHSFRSIVIDIRDAFGQRIPFEYGTLTVTLHFRRNR